MLIVFDRIRLTEASGYPQNGGRISMRALLLDPLRNRLLAALPQPDFALIARHLATTSMPPGLVLNEVDDSVHQVYFPIKGMLSLLAILGERQGYRNSYRRSRGRSQRDGRTRAAQVQCPSCSPNTVGRSFYICVAFLRCGSSKH
jgi:hypothetical protein